MRLLAAPAGERPQHLTLAKDMTKSIKQGHPWIYKEALQVCPAAKPGSLAVIKDKTGAILAKGFYDPDSKLAFRILAHQNERLDEDLLDRRLGRALTLRRTLFHGQNTTGYRLLNGEGDGLPGLTCDVYDSAAVLKLDGAGPEGFYDAEGIAEWLMAQLPALKTCYLKYRSGSEERGRLLRGDLPRRPVRFSENGVRFQADIVQGQKTGFFLDQRDNRARIGRLARGARVLNVFAYTGGFSVLAGVGGAAHVTSVDLARPACDFAEQNWALNDLNPAHHEAIAADAFVFLEQAKKEKEVWDVVIVDPPSFAPSKAALDKAVASYEKIFTMAAGVTANGGLLALSSCSSHLSFPLFSAACEAALQKARRRGAVLCVSGQPEDHPYPAACEELRYLKFALYRVEE